MNLVTQFLHSTCPQGLASMALEVLLSAFLQAGQMRWGLLSEEEEEVVVDFSSVKETVMRVCRE